ncbi:MAG: lytic transglycosylase domain-containing protein [Nitrospinaceae bacterium]|nr:MAG: lytic transglycosylase domain-containing protein [Nitrospinaceae bacterium]
MGFRIPNSTYLRYMVQPGFRKSVLPGVVALVCLGLFSGENSAHHRGVSPYFSASGQFEERVFARLVNEEKSFQEEQDRKVRQKIIRVISRYRTGLPDRRHEEISTLIMNESKRYGYDPLFLTALIVTESSFYNWARSRRGALGLMQLRPATAVALSRETQVKWEGAPTLFNPQTNIVLGAYYLDKLVRRFGDLKLALEAYNHGPSRLEKILKKGYQPRDYSRKVIEKYKLFRSQPI